MFHLKSSTWDSETCFVLKVWFQAYNFIIKRLLRSGNIVNKNTNRCETGKNRKLFTKCLYIDKSTIKVVSYYGNYKTIEYIPRCWLLNHLLSKLPLIEQFLFYRIIWLREKCPKTEFFLNVLFRAYSSIIKRITRSAIIVEINTKDVKLVKANILSLHSKRHLQSISLFT